MYKLEGEFPWRARTAPCVVGAQRGGAGGWTGEMFGKDRFLTFYDAERREVRGEVDDEAR